MFDIAVIGGGSGGLTVAAGAAQFGRNVVLFEKGAMGGDCLNSGCVPSKALLAQAKKAQILRSEGVEVDTAQQFRKAMAHVKSVIASIAPHDSVERFEGLGVKVVQAAAQFVDAHHISAGGDTYAAKRIVIASGSRPAVPPVKGLAEVPYLTNETIFDLTELPQHLLVLGGGPIGIELSQAFRRLGAKVTVLDVEEPLGREDPELSRLVVGQLQHEGIRLLGRTKVASVSQVDGAIHVETETHGMLTGSHLLVATGRRPNIELLNSGAAGVATSQRGVIVDGSMRSSARHIYAVGDVAAGLQFTHVASQQAGLVLKHMLFRLPGRFNADLVPRVTYCDPELASIGLDEKSARAKLGDAVRVYTSPFADNDRARTEGRTDGLVKLVATKSGKILGVSIVGAEAGLLLQPWVLALEQGLSLKAMASNVVAYPSRAEAAKRAALASFAHLPQKSWVRSLVTLINRVS